MENNSANQREIEIDLVALARELLSKIGIILLSTGVVAVAALIISMFFMTPQYQSVTSVYVLNTSQDAAVTYSDLQTATQLTSDYEELIKSRFVMETVIADLGLDMEAEDLSEAVSVSALSGTRMLEIAVTDPDPYRAQSIANAVREVASQQIIEIMNIDAVNLVDTANLPLNPVSPNKTRNTMLGALIGFVLSCGIIALMYVLNDSIRTSSDIENNLGLSVLAIIPDADSLAKKKR